MYTLKDILSDPCWFPSQFDPAWQQLEFVRTDDETLRSSPFLDGRFSQGITERRDLPLATVARALEQEGPTPAEMAVITHSAFCCSTLMAQACDQRGKCLSLKEPDIIMALANAKRMLPQAGRADEFPGLFHLVMTLLSRCHVPAEKILIKPTNAANNLLPEFVAAGLPVLMMYADLKDFLISVLKKGEACKKFIRTQYNIFALDQGALAQIPARQAMTFTDLQVATLVWMHQLGDFHRILQRAASGVRSLQDLDFLENKLAVLEDVRDFFALDLDAGELQEIVTGPVFSRNVKFAEDSFGSEQRRHEANSVWQRYSTEIQETLDWSKSVDLGEKLHLPLPGKLAA